MCNQSPWTMKDYYPYFSVLPWILSPNTSATILLRNYWLVYNLYDCQTAHFRPIGLHCSVPASQQSDSNVIITDRWQWWFNNSSQSAQISLQLTCWTLNWEYRTCYHSYHLSFLISQAWSEGKTTQDWIHGTIVCSACKAHLPLVHMRAVYGSTGCQHFRWFGWFSTM